MPRMINLGIALATTVSPAAAPASGTLTWSITTDTTSAATELFDGTGKVSAGRAADVLNDAFETFNVLNAPFRTSQQPRHLRPTPQQRRARDPCKRG